MRVYPIYNATCECKYERPDQQGTSSLARWLDHANQHLLCGQKAFIALAKFFCADKNELCDDLVPINVLSHFLPSLPPLLGLDLGQQSLKLGLELLDSRGAAFGDSVEPLTVLDIHALFTKACVNNKRLHEWNACTHTCGVERQHIETRVCNTRAS